MKISILTLFPEMFVGPLSESIVKRAIEKNLVSIELVDIRPFGLGSHLMVDDTPYGGGTGMVLRVDVLHAAIEKARDLTLTPQDEKVILMTADGSTYNQKKALSFAKVKHLIIVCGHYEGVDERIREYIDEEISFGDFVLTGGEIPAMAITDSVVRLIPEVLKAGVTENESFSLEEEGSKLLEYPVFTRPPEYLGQTVPGVLISGDHKKIEKWRIEQAVVKTKRKRPDLLKKE